MSKHDLFAAMAGSWGGACRTWFEPEKLADESVVRGAFRAVFNGRFLRHVYEGTLQGKPRRGEDLIAYNAVTGMFQSSWVDSFHMSEAILFSEGKAVDGGFSVLGAYDAGEDLPQWGWRTEYRLLDKDRMTITAFNITPDGLEAKAVETNYRRSAG